MNFSTVFAHQCLNRLGNSGLFSWNVADGSRQPELLTFFGKIHSQGIKFYSFHGTLAYLSEYPSAASVVMFLR